MAFEEVCKFVDTRNVWETREEMKMSGTWSSIQCELIKQAAKCKSYASDLIIDINAMQKKIKNGESFKTHLFFYENGVHSTLELSGNEWSEEKKCVEIEKFCSGLFAEYYLNFYKVSPRDYELRCTEIEGDVND